MSTRLRSNISEINSDLSDGSNISDIEKLIKPYKIKGQKKKGGPNELKAKNNGPGLRLPQGSRFLYKANLNVMFCSIPSNVTIGIPLICVDGGGYCVKSTFSVSKSNISCSILRRSHGL